MRSLARGATHTELQRPNMQHHGRHKSAQPGYTPASPGGLATQRTAGQARRMHNDTGCVRLSATQRIRCHTGVARAAEAQTGTAAIVPKGGPVTLAQGWRSCPAAQVVNSPPTTAKTLRHPRATMTTGVTAWIWRSRIYIWHTGTHTQHQALHAYTYANNLHGPSRDLCTSVPRGPGPSCLLHSPQYQ